ncbi:hypothetical protein PO124_14100 [Bacillus licheniformis]|nr:hypothetical protein [Bacillus licheniformis]
MECKRASISMSQGISQMIRNQGKIMFHICLSLFIWSWQQTK